MRLPGCDGQDEPAARDTIVARPHRADRWGVQVASGASLPYPPILCKTPLRLFGWSIRTPALGRPRAANSASRMCFIN